MKKIFLSVTLLTMTSFAASASIDETTMISRAMACQIVINEKEKHALKNDLNKIEKSCFDCIKEMPMNIEKNEQNMSYMTNICIKEYRKINNF